MLELVLDQGYTWHGVPADRSPYRNHGRDIDTDGGFDGVEPGSGVISFPQAHSRVRIETGQAWQPMVALKIEVLVKVDASAQRQMVLVSGSKSFRFGILEGALEAAFENGSRLNNHVRSADAFAPDHKLHTVPANRWVKLGLHHDGFAKMRLFIEGELVGEAVIDGSVPPVGNNGVSIGNAADQDGLRFAGEIDEVRVWRLDPKAIKREFLGRPYTPKAAKCHEDLLRAIFAWAASNPEELTSLKNKIRSARMSVFRTLFLLPDREQAKTRELLAAFLALWLTGQITGAAMEKVLRDWVAQLKACGLDPRGDGPSAAAVSELASAVPEVKLDGYDVLQCDPDLRGFVALLQQSLEGPGPLAELKP